MRARLGCAVVVLCVAVLNFGAAGEASAQEPRLIGRLPDAPLRQVNAILDAARGARLPTEPLVDRALEGAAKNAPAELIVSAVLRLREELNITRGAFGDEASSAELTAGASALRAGATLQDLARLRQLRPDQPLTVPAAVLADLAAAGVPMEIGLPAVLALAGAAADADYVAFRRSVERDIALGATPAAAVGVRLRAVSDNLPALNSGGESRSTPRKRKP